MSLALVQLCIKIGLPIAGLDGIIQIMFWKDGKYYNVMGRDLSKEKLIKIAESLK